MLALWEMPCYQKKQTSFGLGYDFDALYYLDGFNERLGVGVMYTGNALFGKNSSDAFDIGIYGLALYGVKGNYRFRDADNTFSPYFGMGLGLAQFSTPDITVTDNAGNRMVTEGKSVFSLGLRPEIGLDIGGFLMSVAYVVPMKYSIDSNTGSFDGTAGVLNFSVGYRYSFEL